MCALCFKSKFTVFPHCMECQRGLVMRKVSVCLSNAWIVTKWKKDLFRFFLESVKTLVHAFVTSRIDCCNSVLSSAPKKVMDKWQHAGLQ